MVTVACALPAATVGVPGVPGAATVTLVEAGDAGDVPPTLVAVELNVYAVPVVKPVTVQEVAGEVTVQVAPPGLAVTR